MGIGRSIRWAQHRALLTALRTDRASAARRSAERAQGPATDVKPPAAVGRRAASSVSSGRLRHLLPRRHRRPGLADGFLASAGHRLACPPRAHSYIKSTGPRETIGKWGDRAGTRVPGSRYGRATPRQELATTQNPHCAQGPLGPPSRPDAGRRAAGPGGALLAPPAGAWRATLLPATGRPETVGADRRRWGAGRAGRPGGAGQSQSMCLKSAKSPTPRRSMPTRVTK